MARLEPGQAALKWEHVTAQFASRMARKLREKELEGYGGWEDMDDADIKKAIRRHLRKKTPQWVDIANFALFGWGR